MVPHVLLYRISTRPLLIVPPTKRTETVEWTIGHWMKNVGGGGLLLILLTLIFSKTWNFLLIFRTPSVTLIY